MTEEAIRQYGKAISFDLGLPSAYTNLGVVYWRIALTNQAIEQYRIAIELRPDIADPYNNLGVIYAGLGLLDKARGISSLP